MRSALEHGTSDIKQLFRGYHPGRNWIFGLEQLYMRFPANELPAEGEEDVRRWQPLVPQLISSFQLTRDILLALPLGDHVALERDLYTLGLRATLGLLFRLGGGPAGQAWRFRCGLEAIRLVLDPKGAVQCDQNLRDNVELPLLNCALHCMNASIGKCAHWSLSFSLNPKPYFVFGFLACGDIS